MTFTSFVFFVFLLALSVVYFIFPKKYRWVILLAGSYLFYLSSGFKLVFFLLFSTASSFFAAKFIYGIQVRFKAAAGTAADKTEKAKLKAKANAQKKRIIVLALVINIAILVFYKHINAWIGYLNLLFGLTDLDVHLNQLNLLLPLGISFYTFQSMGYLIDVYRGKMKPDTNFAKYALFVSFFPQLIQGPISRYDELAGQLYKGHSFDFVRAKHGIMLIMWGLFKKLVVGDRMGILVNVLFSDVNKYTGAYALVAGILYSIQLYADFSGGVDVARGAAQIFGIDLPQNFLRPYLANSIPDFWRRWHATLNNWWRDYIFYPLTFSKAFLKFGQFCRKIFSAKWGKLIPIYCATMLVRVINALWHGASLKYIFYGIYHGALIILGMQLEALFTALAKKLKINTDCFSWRLFQIIRTFLLICIGRIITRANGLRDALKMLWHLPDMLIPSTPSKGFGFLFDGSLLNMGLTGNALFVLFLATLLILAVDIVNERGIVLRDVIEKQNILFQWLVLIAGFVAIVVLGAYGPHFSSTAFIYQQF